MGGPAIASRAGRPSWALAGGAVLSLGLPGLASAQAGSVGPAKCYSCHKELAKPVYEKVHKPALAQLDKPNAAGFAKALGQPDAHGPRCLECHSPAVAGPPAGVSCETCHGPGKEYREPHQEPAFYKQPDRKGMRDMYKQPAVVAKLCVDCHVTPDKALAAAGHPTGSDFDPGQAIAKIVHWPSADQGLSRPREYGPAFYKQVADAGRPLVKGRAIAGGGAATRPAAPVAAAGPAAAVPRPAPPRAAAPAPAPVAVPLSSDDPLFAEQVPLYEGASGGGAAAPARAAAPRPAARRPPPSIAEDRPTGLAEPALVPAVPATPPPVAAPAVAASPAPAPSPPSPAAADARVHTFAVLERLLKTRAHQLELPAPAPPAEFRGTDSELLRIQDEILALALEALRRPLNP